MKKLRFSSLVLLLVVAALFLTATTSIFAADKSKQHSVTTVPYDLALSWTKDPYTTQTITWKTGTLASRAMVQYAETGKRTTFPGQSKVITATILPFKSKYGSFTVNSATLPGLTPGTTYRYRVGDGKRWSAINTFTTERKGTQPFKFLMFGDSQSSDRYTQWKSTIQTAFKRNQDARFFVNLGDLVDQGKSQSQWEDWFAAAKGVINFIPAMPVRGNHDTYTPFWTAQFKLPLNGPVNAKGLTYSFDYGNAHLIMLDYVGEHDTKTLQAQCNWLANDLKNTRKTWKLLFFHTPPYYNKTGRPNEYLKQAYIPIFDKYHVDMVFNGHDHAIARTYPMNNSKEVTSPAQGTVYYTTGRSGTKYYDDSSVKAWDTFFSNPISQPNYIVATLDNNTLTIKTFGLDGTTIDTFSINK